MNRSPHWVMALCVAAALLVIAPSVVCAGGAHGSRSPKKAQPTATPAAAAAGGALQEPAAASAGVSSDGAATAGGEGALSAAQLKALAKMTQNPVGNIAILPFQNNWNYAAGQTKATVWNMNIQPVVPIMLSPKANLIERVIAPVVNLPPLLDAEHCRNTEISSGDLTVFQTPPCSAQLGIGNIQLQSYYAPKTNPNGFIYGYGPILSFPTVTKDLGTQQFGAGINAVGLVMPGSWVLGMLVTQRWYVAGPSTTPESTLNSFLAQPFINWNFGKGWALSEAPIITANWNEPGSQKWTVPIGLAVINTNTWLKLPMSYQLAYYGNVVRPPYAPYGLIRFSWSIIWPVKRGLGVPGQ